MNIPAGLETDTVVRLETNLDDVLPEIAGAVMDRLFEAGALDVWYTPVHMKKNRPGMMLSALCSEEAAGECATLILKETSAFGIRVEKVLRLKLARRFETVTTPHGEITLKLGLKGEEIVQVSPEFESCQAAAARTGKPLKAMYEAALVAWRNRAG
jgi:uncharacterized protein (DUF111 family)